MSTISELDAVITDLRDAAAAINAAANSLTELFSANTSVTEVHRQQEENEQPTPLTLPEVRAILSEKSKAGYTAQIKELLLKHGSATLSGIDPSQYASLLAEVEVLGNG